MSTTVRSFISLIIPMLTILCLGEGFSQTEPLYNESWALLVGVNKYKNLPARFQLRFAVNDVERMAELLRDGFGFQKEKVITLTDDQATKRGIEIAMSQFADPEKIHKADRVLIYFSGHGATVTLHDGTKMGFLVTHDAEIDFVGKKPNPADYLRTCIGMERLRALSKPIPAKHVLFLVDSCYSGLAIRDIPSLEPTVPNYIERVARLESRQIITAGLSGEQVTEERGHGVFTYHLLEALRHGLADQPRSDNFTTATELGTYLSKVVAGVSDGKQNPHFGRFYGQGEFLFQHRRDAPPPDEKPPQLEILEPAGLQNARALTVEAGVKQVRLVGVVTDDVGVVSVKVNGQPVHLTRGTEVILPQTQVRFETTVDLTSGKTQAIEIQAFDAAGNSASLQLVIHPPDTKPPTIEITQPPPQALSNDTSVWVKAADRQMPIRLVGVARDNIGVTRVTVNEVAVDEVTVDEVTVNEVPDQATDSLRELGIERSEVGVVQVLRFEAEISPADTTLPSITVELRAYDAAGNVRKLTVTIELPPEGMVLIPAGEFWMGSLRGVGDDNEYPRHKVSLSGFYMDKYEVTLGEYKQFIEATGHRDPDWSKIAKYSPTDQHSVVLINWYDAVSYAQWAGKRLPTEAEWEKAARGGRVGARYPWDNTITHNDANFHGMGGRDRWKYNAPVGSFSRNSYGLYDIVGNVWEWCADWYHRDYYAKSPSQNPKGPHSGRSRVIRGGSWDHPPDDLRVANRCGLSPAERYADVGFRCAKDVIPP